jgi:hypothetical protein
VTLTTHPHLVPRSRMSRISKSSPPQAPLWRVVGTAFNFSYKSYGLDDRVIWVRSPAEAKDFSSSLESRSALGPTQPPVQWVPGDLSPGVKRGRGVTLPLTMSRSYTSSPPSACVAYSGTSLHLVIARSVRHE